MTFQVGDKVRIKVGPEGGARGVISGFESDAVSVRVDPSGRTIKVTVDEVTNFSLAARKAWISMPQRAVGRPRGLKLCDRVSVTLRIDRGLWERFRANELSGRIRDRTLAVNTWLREKLDALEKAGTHT